MLYYFRLPSIFFAIFDQHRLFGYVGPLPAKVDLFSSISGQNRLFQPISDHFQTTSVFSAIYLRRFSSAKIHFSAVFNHCRKNRNFRPFSAKNRVFGNYRPLLTRIDFFGYFRPRLPKSTFSAIRSLALGLPAAARPATEPAPLGPKPALGFLEVRIWFLTNAFREQAFQSALCTRARLA